MPGIRDFVVARFGSGAGSRPEYCAFFGVREGTAVAKLIGGAGAKAKHGDEGDGGQWFKLFHGYSLN